MIVKVQMQQMVPTGVPRKVLVYTEHRKVYAELPCTDDVEELLAGRPKAFFEARIEGSQIRLLDEVNNPGW